ncbi:hypothetical protein RD792_018147 [Penstemon davidsonii]|uniref:TIR domain-containing protein n=1 Tax=Penstemon davidsonii TaxID=160366 RepID=A0ABR0DV20_9LAMI|nr:hypothetical protein RD792_018147 [Penstemon davidsonii]
MAGKRGSSVYTSEYAYDIFLSFRGEGTRKIFTTRLYSALMDAGFSTFIDDSGIERGEDIKSELIRAIHHSRGSIVVLSENYANSSWCLDELAMIVENKKSKGHVILPVFYHVTKSDVGSQMGGFAEAFAFHEKCCLEEYDEVKKSEWLSKIQKWRDALTQVAALGGMNLTLQNDDDDEGYATGFIKKIVEVIEDKLNRAVLPGAHEFVGIGSRVKGINAWLHNGSSEVGILVLCGTGGIGKTTTAKFVYNLNYQLFEASSFLADIREISQKHNGLLRLQQNLLSDILRGEQTSVDSVEEGSVRIQAAIEQKRTLLVMDDVDRINQLDAILGMRDWLLPGSRVIITTRNESLMNPSEVYKVHTIKPLSYEESSQLFCWYAFGQDDPFEHYMSISNWVINRCRGLPLVLKVIGSSLFGKSLPVWGSILRKLEEIPSNQIQNLLQISYDSLSDDHDKNLFLHIACFFVGMKKDYVVRILDECGFHTMVGIENLTNRCLLTINPFPCLLLMHKSLEDMGREVVRRESPKRPEERSRLCHYRDSLNVLKYKTGTEATEGLILDMRFGSHDSATWSAENDSTNPSSNLETDAFKEMRNLELLQLDYVHLSGSFEHLPRNLKWFRWHGFSLKSIPGTFPMDKLVILDMSNSRLVRFWKQNKIARFMKILNLSHSLLLINTPEFSGFPNLEILILRGCINLSDVHKSLGYLKRLLLLDLHDCKSLSKLPNTIVLLNHLHTLVISGCTNLHQLPTDMNKMTSLKVLNADGIAKSNFLITQEDDIGSSNSCGVWSLIVSKPKKAPQISSWASLPNSLRRLSLSDCNLTEDTFPNDIGNFTSLKKLDLSRNPLCSLPHFVSKLSSLQDLQLESCVRLRSLLGLPDISNLELAGCGLLKTITHLSTSSKLHYISYNNCGKLNEVQGLFCREPLEKFSVETLNNFGFFNLEPLKDVEVNFQDGITTSIGKRPIQLLYEFGIFSTSMLGSQIPDWNFSYKTIGSSVSFTVPSSTSDLQIQGLNLCFVYAVSNSTSNNDEKWFPENILFIKIRNKTKDLEWIYYPTCFGIPEPDNDLLWLSHWTFRNELEDGNEVDISIITGDNFVVRECGLSFMYHEQKEDIWNKYLSWREVIGGDLSAFRLSTGSYYLCRTAFVRYYEEKGVSRLDDWTTTNWGRRSLVYVDNDNKLLMHQLIQKMGKEILRRKLRNDPASTSRLLHFGGSFNVLKQNNVSETREGIKDKSLCVRSIVTDETKRFRSHNLDDESILRFLLDSLKRRFLGLLGNY